MYTTIKQFKECQALLNDSEVEELINEALIMNNNYNIKIMDYINFEIDSINNVNREFNNQKNLI